MYVHYDGLDMYRYSPAFAVAISPLAGLPIPLGGAVWGIGSVLVLYRGLAVLHRDVLAQTIDYSHRGQFLILSAIGIAPLDQ